MTDTYDACTWDEGDYERLFRAMTAQSEVRRVEPDWKHPAVPKKVHGVRVGEGVSLNFIPLHTQPYESALQEWWQARELWVEGEHPKQEEDSKYLDWAFEEYWGQAPRRLHLGWLKDEGNNWPLSHSTYTNLNLYAPEELFPDQERTAYQLYQTVSEGTPLTPVFETLEGLADWIHRWHDWDYDNALTLVKNGGSAFGIMKTEEGDIQQGEEVIEDREA